MGKIQSTVAEYRTALNGYRAQAKAAGLDTNDEKVRRFIIHISEVTAQTHAELRESYNANHRLMRVTR